MEWPGGKPGQIEIEVDPDSYQKLVKGKGFIPPTGLSLAESAGLPWGTMATVRSNDEKLRTVVGPAKFRHGEWQLPVFWQGDTAAEARKETDEFRRQHGFEPFGSTK